jgi:predicted PurR-regulated permease PerM
MKILPEEIQDAIQKLDYQKLVEGIVNFLTNGANVSSGAGIASLTSLLGSLTSGFMTGFMGFIFSIYILLGKEKLRRQFRRLFRSYLSTGWVEKIDPFLAVVDNCFHSFIVGQITEGIIIGVLCAVGMWIFRLPYAAMIGTVIGVTALIPVLGCYLGAIVGALMCLSVSPFKAVEFLVFIFCLQQLEDNLIYPRVVGTSLGLPGIWVIASVSVGGGIGGIFGMVLAVPITATIYQLLRMDVQKREQADSRKMTAADVVGKLKEEADK